MLDRRRAVQGSLASLGIVAAPFNVLAQAAPPVKVRYSEVVHSIFYAPAYVAMAKGISARPASTSRWRRRNGGDKAMAALITNSADIALIGPEAAIYVQNSESPTKTPIFCGLTATDGFMLVGREQGRQVRLEHAEGQGDPRLPAGQTP